MYGIIFAYKNINEYKRKKLFFKSENIDGKKKFVNGIKGKGDRKGVRFIFLLMASKEKVSDFIFRLNAKTIIEKNIAEN